MGNVFSSCSCRRNRIGLLKEITLLMIGLDNAGKTCTAKHLLGESVADAVPTVGFTSIQLKHGKFNVHIYDIGGGPKIRGIWNNYYALVHGLIFVVDASDMQRFEECKIEIRNVLKDQRIAGKPMLLLFNKQDLDDTVNETELVNHLDLETLVNEQQCPTRVEASSAIYDGKKSKDPGIKEGFGWLIAHIEKEFPALNERVEREKAVQTQREQEERQQRMERVQRLREERERAAKELDATKDDDDDVIEGNPFKSMNSIREELERRVKPTPIASPMLPAIKVIHVSPSNSSSEREEIILRPRLLEATPLASHDNEMDDPSQLLDATTLNQPQSFSTSVLVDEEEEKKKRLKKPKKRFKNRVGPQDLVIASSSHLSPVTNLPPLRPIGETFLNGDLPTYNSPKRKNLTLNGKMKLTATEGVSSDGERLKENI